MAVMLERRGNKKINVILLDTYIRNKYIQQIGTRNFDKERLRQLSIEKEYDAEYIDKILSIVHIEEEIANSLISGYLLYTHAVLFKATQVEDEVHQIMTNNVDLVTENLKVITLNCHHMNILETNSTTIGNYLLSKQSNIKGLHII
jgi:thioesterase domain-containing protein